MWCLCINSGAPAARRVAKRSPNSYKKENETHELTFLMFIMASGIVRGRVHTRRTTESSNMATILPIVGEQRKQPWFTVYFFDTGHPYHDQLTPAKTEYLLTSITWPYRGPKSTTLRGHVFFLSWPLTKCWFWIQSRAHVRLTCWKQGRIVRKPVSTSPGLKFIRIVTSRL